MKRLHWKTILVLEHHASTQSYGPSLSVLPQRQTAGGRGRGDDTPAFKKCMATRGLSTQDYRTPSPCVISRIIGISYTVQPSVGIGKMAAGSVTMIATIPKFRDRALPAAHVVRLGMATLRKRTWCILMVHNQLTIRNKGGVMDDIDRGELQLTGEIEDRRLITELLQNWVVWRDAGDGERFRAVWHPDGRMMATWMQGTGVRL